jgi:hypothetical protein
MPYKDPTSKAAKDSLKRRHDRYRDSGKAAIRTKRYNDLHGRNNYYRFEHGITEAEFEAQITAQNNLCPIGNHPFGERGKKNDSPCQDHDHETGKNRAILCRKHNVGIGYFGDSMEELEAAIQYLRQYKESSIGDLNV